MTPTHIYTTPRITHTHTHITAHTHHSKHAWRGGTPPSLASSSSSHLHLGHNISARCGQQQGLDQFWVGVDVLKAKPVLPARLEPQVRPHLSAEVGELPREQPHVQRRRSRAAAGAVAALSGRLQRGLVRACCVQLGGEPLVVRAARGALEEGYDRGRRCRGPEDSVVEERGDAGGGKGTRHENNAEEEKQKVVRRRKRAVREAIRLSQMKVRSERKHRDAKTQETKTERDCVCAHAEIAVGS